MLTLGWLNDSCIIVSPNRISNVGRFINSAAANNSCKCSLGLLRYTGSGEKEDYKVCLYIYTTKSIAAG